LTHRTLKLTIQYDGTNYVGWQRQAQGISIQGLLEEALYPFEGEPLTVHGAGRTDAGVHALGQVASVRTRTGHSCTALQRALNSVLPVDVRVVAVEDAAADFHARFNAVSKTYEYRIVQAPFVSPFDQRYVWHVPGRLDLEAMRRGAQVLLGRHDFAAFQSVGGDVHTSERTILFIDVVERAAGLSAAIASRALVIRVTGDGFLRHMVRTIAGTLADVGLGRWQPEKVTEILASRDRARAGRAAPAAGLFLVEVNY